MRIILLATDEAPTLAPLTDTTPAPLVTVVNRPLLGIALELLARAGIKHALVSLCNRSGEIAAHLNSGRRWGMNIDLVTQREALGTAGALRFAGQLLNETFLVLPADMILDLDIEAALDFHRTHGGWATVIAQQRAGVASASSLSLAGTLVTAVGTTDGLATHATGAYIFEASVLSLIPANVTFDTLRQLLPALISSGSDVHAFHTSGYWNPMQSFVDYREAQRVFLTNAYHTDQPAMLATLGIPRLRYPAVDGRQIAPGIWVGLNDVIHPSANLAAPICIGDNCWIGREAEVGPEVVIGANAVIDEEATVERATVMERTYVGRLLKLVNVVADRSTLIDLSTSQSVKVVDSFLLSEIGTEAPSGFFRRIANLIGATALLLLVLPLLLVLGLVSLLTTGRIIQHERRIGSRPPTLRARQETGPYPFAMLRLATERDGKTTAYGRWLLSSSLAYLPALLNVIRAECELVGVAPLQPSEAEQITETWQQKHYDRPAGLTGAWYTQTTTASQLDDIFVIDGYYVATRTWRGDILLVWHSLTIWLQRLVVPSRRGADGRAVSDMG